MRTNRNGLRVFGHPIHSMVIHFPIALWTISLIWDLLGMISGNAIWWILAFWSILAGLAIALLAAITGVFDFATISRNHPAEKVAILHMIFVLIAAGMYTCSLLVRFDSVIPQGSRLIIAVICSWIGFLALILGSWYGGKLVYQYSIGVKKNQNPEYLHARKEQKKQRE